MSERFTRGSIKYDNELAERTVFDNFAREHKTFPDTPGGERAAHEWMAQQLATKTIQAPRERWSTPAC
jgi:hypothetical protein